MRICVGRTIGVAAGLVLWGWAGVLAAQDDLLAELPDGPGKEEAFYTCNPCHSFRLVAQQGLPRARWDKLLDWMIEEQGMPELEAGERSLILDYLTTHFGIDRGG